VGERDRYGKPRRRHRRLRVAGRNHGRARGGQPQDKVRTLRSSDDSALKFGDAILDRWTTGSAPCCAKLGSSLHPREGVACASAGGRLEIVKGLLVCLESLFLEETIQDFLIQIHCVVLMTLCWIGNPNRRISRRKREVYLSSFSFKPKGEPFWRY